MYPKLYLFERIKKARLLIDRRFDQQLSLPAIARQVSLSQYHFLRLFKEAYGVSPHQYLQQRRIDEAKRLLKKGMSVGNVCEAVGFQSVSSFTHLFKKSTGTTPGKFHVKSCK